jgi:hypothetical protein
MSWAPRQIPRTIFPASMAREIRRFSGASQECAFSSFTLIGPPMTMTQSKSSRPGSDAPSKSRTVVTGTWRASIHAWMDPMPSYGTC